jgi:two-component SAPR family response regulator
MRVIVIDDEKAMHLVMNQMLSRIHDVEVAGCYQHPADAMEQIRNEAIDLVFIDINLGHDNGLEVARGLRSAHRELDIVFVTSHKEYAIDSFDSYPLDYMIKPVSQSRLEQTIARAAARIGEKSSVVDVPIGKLTVRALGGLEVKTEQGEPVKWISRKSMELFAYLLMHRGSPVSKSRIIEYIYPDMPIKNAAIYINTTVYQLRKSLHASGHKHIIANSLEQYWLLFDPIEADFVMFEDQVSRFSTLSAENIEAALACERLYTGELFDERSYVWAAPEQIRLHELYIRFAKQIGRWLLQHQESEQAARLIKKLVSRSEWDEETHLLLLEAYGKLGDSAALARHYEHVTDLYQKELSIPTPSEFTKLYERYRELI